MNISDIIWEIRHVTRFNQGQIAEEVECTQATLSRLLKNKCKPSYIVAKNILNMAKKYKIKVDVTLDDLVYTGKNK